MLESSYNLDACTNGQCYVKLHFVSDGICLMHIRLNFVVMLSIFFYKKLQSFKSLMTIN